MASVSQAIKGCWVLCGQGVVFCGSHYLYFIVYSLFCGDAVWLGGGVVGGDSSSPNSMAASVLGLLAIESAFNRAVKFRRCHPVAWI